MLLSRIVALMLGTTLFITVWAMQDEHHGAPGSVMAGELRPLRQTEHGPQPRRSPAIEVTNRVPVNESASTSAEGLWIFADETSERIATKLP